MTTAHVRQILRGTVLAVAALAAAWEPWTLNAQAPQMAKGVKYAQISQADMKEWLSYQKKVLHNFPVYVQHLL